MDRLREMEVFVAVADAGSLAAAGRRLRLSPPAVTRAVAALEERIGARLLNRTTRSLSLTEAGRRFLESARRLIHEVEEAEREAAGETAVPQGHLAVTASVTFGRLALGPILVDFLDAHPRVTAALVALDRVVDVVDEGIDVAVRIGDLPDSSMVARRVGEVRRIFVASPAYLDRRGPPRHPSELALHDTIGFTGASAAREWRFREDGRPIVVPVAPRFEVNDAAAATAAAEAGAGITIAFCYLVGEPIRVGRLVPVLEPFWPPTSPVHVVYPSARLLAPKVRAFVDFAAPRLVETIPRLSARERPGPAA